MSSEIPVTVPDIGDFEDVDVVEIMVTVGDNVNEEDPLVTLESEKAAMDIPAPITGKIAQINVSVGDKVSEGSIIVLVTASIDENDDGAIDSLTGTSRNIEAQQKTEPQTSTAVPVPNIGDFDKVDVIEIFVRVGDTISAEDPIVTLESDKATMDIPAPFGGLLESIHVVRGDKVSEGDIIATIAKSESIESSKDERPSSDKTSGSIAPEVVATQLTSAPVPATTANTHSSKAYASPSVRKFARELGVDINLVSGSGRKGRITKSDVQKFVKVTISGTQTKASTGSYDFPRLPDIDFSQFGPIDIQPLSKIKRLTGQNMQRSWITAPHVTQFDEADITELEEFRKSKLVDAKQNNIKLTLLAFLIKAVVVVLQKYPDFNSSLSSDGESIIRKNYFHIGVAVNTDRGLLVPVIRDADKKGLFDLASEVSELSTKARERKLKPADMQGGCFTISSLGGVGGTAFTPIINIPEVAILGISPSVMKPVYLDDEFVPRLRLPYALSFDHRVLDGVAGAQFTRHLGVVLSDIRHILL
ncbi:MAG TPA: dihydrolipoamide acetyltransferase [Gammaproteobacteria bacterium]|nr:dihydrolipoamide acetyltransferase [Gammaproteobacteria bacterium]